MMEVKQNNAVDLNDLLTSSKSSVTDEVDDALMQDLSDKTASLVNCDIIKPNDQPGIVEEDQNGDTDMTSLIKDIDDEVDVDLNIPVNSELEDALLAEDDVSPEVLDNKTIDPILSTADVILAEKSETSNSTTSSSNNRDPGDDLDTLLSKINDIVEDCIDKENENVAPTTELDKSLNKEENIKQDTEVNHSEFEIEEKNINNDSKKCIEEEISQITADEHNGIDKTLELKDETKNLIDVDRSLNPDLDIDLPTPENTAEEKQKREKDKTDIKENEVSLDETEVSNNKDLKIHAPEITENIIDNNLNLEKTEEPKEEVVQDNKINSNCNEIVDSVDTPHPTTNDNDEKSLIPNTNGETTNSMLSAETKIADETFDITQDQTDEKSSNEETVASKNPENDDSDDEIVFYVDKPPEEEKQDASKDKSLLIEGETDKTKEVVSSPAKENGQDDDDIVLLLDDDDEEINTTKKDLQTDKEICETNSGKQVEANISTSKNAETKEKVIVVDNSDNARDDFASDNSTEKEKPANKTVVNETPEETNSNCSSSSNLLQESKSIKVAADENTPEDIENEEEEDDGDVELIIGDSKEPESDKADDSEIAPPAKRIRLDGEEDLKKHESCDGSEELEPPNDIKKKQESLDNTEQEKNTSTTLKRSHDVIELEGDEKSNNSNDGCSKKPKTDEFSKKIDMALDDDKQFKDEQIVSDEKKDLKAVPSYEPIRLYPAPKLGVLKSELPMSLEYLKKFRKSFDNMTKQDLEELALQKVVEAIVHKSEFSEMRELIEKQEKLISAHRTKISELSKQFRDLEMVHNRVVKDIEQRNSQFIMPVKITRAVGLQVYIPTKKSLVEPTSNSIIQSIPTSPQRPVSSQGSSISSTSLTTQRQFLSSQTDSQSQRSLGTSSSVSANAGNIRRGCVQKITPIRPVPGSSQSPSSGPSASLTAPYRSAQSHTASTQPRILNKNATTNQNATTLQRSRFGGPNQDGQRIPSQQVSRPPSIPTNSQRVVANTTTSKPSPAAVAAVQRRSEPLPSQTSTNSTSIVDNYLNTLTHLTGGNTAVSITPAKPKEKAVIDLTDEDESPAQSAGVQPVTQIPGSQVQRRSLPVQNNTNSQIHGRAAPNMARVPPASQMSNNKNRQISSMQAQKNNSFTSISTPAGTSITRINVAPNNSNVQRVKYSHPAPLPATPPQAFNPSWKLPPPRPTIRISNLDNGIVISWTMEESMDRHAECVSYQIYAYQETSGPPMVDSWRHVGDVKAMLLPMAVTLTQFQEGQRYYFAVRAVDCHQRYGPFSLPKTWS